MITKTYPPNIASLRNLLTYIYPSLRSRIDSSLAYSEGERQLVAISSLIKTFAIAGQPQGVIQCLHYLLKDYQELISLNPEYLRRAMEVEIQRISALPSQIKTLHQLTSGHEQYVLKLLGTYAATLVNYALRPEAKIRLPNGEGLQTSYLGNILESAITSTRLLLPDFVEQSGVYVLVSRLCHEDIHFAVEFIDKAAHTDVFASHSHQLLLPVTERYGISHSSSPIAEDPRASGVSGYLRDPNALQYVYLRKVRT